MYNLQLKIIQKILPIKSASKVGVEDPVHNGIKCTIKEEKEDEESEEQSGKIRPNMVVPVDN